MTTTKMHGMMGLISKMATMIVLVGGFPYKKKHHRRVCMPIWRIYPLMKRREMKMRTRRMACQRLY